MANREIEYVIKADNTQAIKAIDEVFKKSSLAQQLRQGGDIGEITAVKKFGKNFGEFLGLGDGTQQIKDTAGELRMQAALKLREEYKAINTELATGQATELRITKLQDLKVQAAERYKRTLADVRKAEAEALKGGGGNGLARGIAVAGGTLAVISAAGKVAEAWDKANQKLEEGKIHADQFAAEVAKGIPIIGGVVQGAETLALVISGIAKDTREWNAESAMVGQNIAAFRAKRQSVLNIGREFDPANEVGSLTSAKARDLAILDKYQRERVVSAEDAARAREALEANYEDKLTKARQKVANQRADIAKREADAVYDIQKKSTESQAALAADLKEAAGDKIGAEIDRLRERTRSALADIEQKIADAKANRDLTEQGRRDLIAALTGNANTIRTDADIRQRMIEGQRNIPPDIKPLEALVRIGREKVGAEDARFTSGLYQQQHKLEVEQAKTAKEMLAEMKTLNDRLRVVRLN